MFLCDMRILIKLCLYIIILEENLMIIMKWWTCAFVLGLKADNAVIPFFYKYMFVNIIEIASNKGANSYTIHVVKIQNT